MREWASLIHACIPKAGVRLIQCLQRILKALHHFPNDPGWKRYGNGGTASCQKHKHDLGGVVGRPANGNVRVGNGKSARWRNFFAILPPQLLFLFEMTARGEESGGDDGSQFRSERYGACIPIVECTLHKAQCVSVCGSYA